MYILSKLSLLAAEYSAARTRYLTERQIHALPSEIRKDIGWPDASSRAPSRLLGVWAGDR